jgi:O-antigen/teichoic acid export membrane protein
MIIKHLTSQWMAAIYTAVVSMGLTFVLGRLLGPEAFGTYSYILTLASFFFILQDGGFKTLIFREKTLPTPGFQGHGDILFPMAFGNGLMVTAAGAALVFVLPLPYKSGILAALICFFFQALANFISSELKAEGKFPKEALWQTIVRTAGAVGIIFVLCFLSRDPWVIFIGWAFGLLLALWFSPRKIPRPIFMSRDHKGIWRACLAFMAIDAATTIYYRCDILLLKHLSQDAVQVGYYAAAYRFLDGIVLLAAPVGMIWFRKLRLVREDKRLFYSRVVKMALVMVGSAGFVLAAGIIFGEKIVVLTFGKNYTDTIRILPLLLGALIFILPNYILTQAAIAQNRERLYAAAVGICALFNMGLNFILIPEFGGIGAAWATIVTEALLLVILVLSFKWKDGRQNKNSC